MIYDATISPSVAVYFDATRYLKKLKKKGLRTNSANLENSLKACSSTTARYRTQASPYLVASASPKTARRNYKHGNSRMAGHPIRHTTEMPAG